MQVGAHYGEGAVCDFVVWAPSRNSVSVKIVTPELRLVPLERKERGYWQVRVENVEPGARYLFELDGDNDKPDPASHFQPDGPHEPSQIVNHHAFRWSDNDWRGMALSDMIAYELHLGTFTPQSTFDGVIDRIDYLIELGVNAIELMPVAQFPGDRNWGYDGAYLYAVHNSYGRPEDLKRLVDRCHTAGLAVILDVVYNHLGPEGNYIEQFCPFFTEKYTTPWGKAVNFDDAHSDGVREFIIDNALHWFERYHIDALRLDAIHGIFDFSAKHILREMAERVETFDGESGRKHYLIAESDLNDRRVIDPASKNGYGVDGQWSDDFHHAVHALLTGEDQGYYKDFGQAEDLAVALREGFVYSWKYSEYRKRYHGSNTADIPGDRFVVFIQNHDQVGNRLRGERLSQLVSFEAAKLAAGLLLTAPYVPLIFMGEEFAEPNPFLYFVSHSDQWLIDAVRQGRKDEFKAFGWKEDPPDPKSHETFDRCRLSWEKREKGNHAAMFRYYQTLIQLRKSIPGLRIPDGPAHEVSLEKNRILGLYRAVGDSSTLCLANLGDDQTNAQARLPKGAFERRLDSSDTAWSGPGSASPERIRDGDDILLNKHSIVIYEKTDRT